MKVARVGIIAVALVALALPVTEQAMAQGMGGMGGGKRGQRAAATPGSDAVKKKHDAEAAAAKAAMDKIPDSKEKYDPWRIGR